MRFPTKRRSKTKQGPKHIATVFSTEPLQWYNYQSIVSANGQHVALNIFFPLKTKEHNLRISATCMRSDDEHFAFHPHLLDCLKKNRMLYLIHHLSTNVQTVIFVPRLSINSRELKIIWHLPLFLASVLWMRVVVHKLFAHILFYTLQLEVSPASSSYFEIECLWNKKTIMACFLLLMTLCG